ncbi:hypothetical protein BDQ94DRAFT_132946 [Aspergillus welwitschiae]|uniref:Uncharacterized protein n=1 Tax=Aspergillus welwitschiae TaxID=1341132 RepID=A0A3F3QKH9_9EURO|nr:hypothetical protein BDQ94DRAFT_132946 [Aspergillus welwitschiae]RDH39362.1 hypothetical protein BDQ94DRAFT_132946 [Aspergillus welwitschiae]
MRCHGFYNMRYLEQSLTPCCAITQQGPDRLKSIDTLQGMFARRSTFIMAQLVLNSYCNTIALILSAVL